MTARVLTLVVVLAFAGVGVASAITIDGVNDFPPASLIDPDGGDTEFAEIDFGDIYIHYDAAGLYVGYYHDQGIWTGVQIGISFVTIATGGGTTDPWSHQIGFTGMCLPDFIAYINLDSEWNEWCVWNGSDWDRTPGLLSWSVATDFDEVAIPYTMLGVDCAEFSQVFIELWVTQDGTTKGPLDLSYNDDLQLSNTGGTTWDTDTPVIISCYHCIELYGPSATEMSTWGDIKALYR
jgi:hypothetical protein